ncbi:MAG: TorD/DmsD family molecular chaperone [Thermoleophilia bacterium]
MRPKRNKYDAAEGSSAGRQALEDRVDELFFDYREARFWKKEALDHLYLSWLRATLDVETEGIVAYEKVPASMATGGLDSAGRARSRSDAYCLFAAAFNEPDTDLVLCLSEGNFRSQLAASLEPWSDLRPVSEGLVLLAEVERQCREQPGSAADELLTGYTSLFMDSRLPFIPPYESVYRGERQVMGECAVAVQKSYAQVGLGVVGAELPDHIMHECEFMAYVCRDEGDALAAGDASLAESLDAQGRRFLEEHLLPWGARFCSDIQTIGPIRFYDAISLAFYGFLSAEADYLA